MSTCTLSPEKIKTESDKLRKELKLSVKNNTVDKFLNSVSTNYSELGDVAIEVIRKFGDKFGFDKLNLSLNDNSNIDEVIKNRLQQLKTITINQFESLENLTTDIIEKPVSLIKDVRKDFLITAFGPSINARRSVEKQNDVDLFNAIIINREKGYSVLTNKEMNINIREYQERLFSDIKNYLGLSDDYKMYKLNPDTNTIEYTGVLEELKNDIDTFIKTIIPVKLDDYYFNGTQREKQLLKAYSAFLMLTHFDSLMQITYGKSIKIKNFSDLDFTIDKYELTKLGSNIKTTWQQKDVVNVSDNVDNRIKQLINTTKLINSETGKEVGYLQFGDFVEAICDIKQSSLNKLDINFNEYLESKNINVDTLPLSNITKRLIVNNTYKQLVDKIRTNPKKYITAIFELINSDIFGESILTKMFPKINKMKKSIFYSIYKGITNINFDSDSYYSINNISKNKIEDHTYDALCEVVDSIFGINFLQYYKNQKGEIILRNMKGTRLDDINRNLQFSIKTHNSKLKGNLFTNLEDNAINIRGIIVRPITDNGNFKGVSIEYNDGEFKINPQILTDGTVSNINPKFVDFTRKYNPEMDRDKITNFQLSFISNVLGINIDNNIIENMSGDGKSDLFSLANRVLFDVYVSNKILTDNKGNALKSSRAIKNKLQFVLNTSDIRIDTQFKEIDLIHPKDVDTMEKLANAYALTKGLYSNTQVKSGDGATQSNNTLSRLLGNFRSQWETQCKSQNSPNKNALIMKSGLLVDYCRVKEFYDLSEATDVTKMNVKELSYSSFMNDFVKCLVENDKSFNNIIKNKVAAFTASVNSDKNELGKLIIDLGYTLPLEEKYGNLQGKQLIELNEEELYDLTQVEFGEIYTNTAKNILSDFNKFIQYFNSVNEEGIRIPPINYYNSDSFKQFNNAFALRINGESLQEARTQAILNNQVEFAWGDKIYSINDKTCKDEFLTQPLINKYLKQYNLEHLKEPIEFVDLVYFSNNKNGSIEINHVLEEYIDRFTNPNKINLKLFFRNKKCDLLLSLCRNDVEFDVSTDSPENEFIKNNYPDWISDKGTVIFAKIKYNNREYNISNKYDLNIIEYYYPELKDILYNPNTLSLVDLNINPLLSLYNMLDYILTQEWMDTTVGSLISHPGHTEAEKYNAQHKRNVQFTATMSEFAKNLLNGIPNTYNVAVVADVLDYQSTIDGNVNRIKPYDGATYVDPTIVYLENNSLGDNAVGITKKQFMHFYNEKTGTGGIIKTCGFGLTNDWMRNSPRLRTLCKKMMSNIWTDKEGNDITDKLNITYDFTGKSIDFSNIFFKHGNKIYKIDTIEKVGSGYDIQGIEVNAEIDENCPYLFNIKGATGELNSLNSLFNLDGSDNLVTIKSNYDLYKVLGAEQSYELKNGQLVPSENSIKKLVEVINSIGYDQNYNSLIMSLDNNDHYTQEDIYQPLKYSNIHYAVTEGAMKHGIANFNDLSAYEDDGESLNFMRIKSTLHGIQLNKEHTADDEELSLMTQVINACAHNGYTAKQALELYKSLGILTENGISEMLNPLKDYINNNSEENRIKVLEAIINSVLKTYSDKNIQESNILSVFTADLFDKLKEGKLLKYDDFTGKLPLDNPAVYNKFMSSLFVFITQNGIKMKIPGILSVLTPSKGIMTIYNIPIKNSDGSISYRNVKYADLEIEAHKQGFISVNDYLNNIQSNVPPVFDGQTLDLSKIHLGRTYVCEIYNETNVPEIEYIQIDTPKDYLILKNNIKNRVYNKVTESISHGRDLATYDINFTLNDGTAAKLYDLDTIQALSELLTLKETGDFKHDTITFNQFVSHYPELFNNYKVSANVKNKKKIFKNFITERLKKDLLTLSPEINGFETDNKVLINNQYYSISNIKKEPYELILPKTFIKEFGLNQYDQIQYIESDKDFFAKKLIKKLYTTVDDNQFDVALINLSGKHYYLKQGPVENAKEIKPAIYQEGNKYYVVDYSGNKLFECNKNDKFYEDDKDNIIISVLSNEDLINSLNNLNYSTIKLSSDLEDNNILSLLNLIKLSNNKKAKKYYKYLNIGINGDREHDLDLYINRNEQLNKNADILSQNNPIINMLKLEGLEIRTSFFKSLDVVASRTPSQSMQSFMPMKIVAFDNPNLNTAFVSTMQILLQGSDYDVDAASIATYAINKSGKLSLWSPYASLNNENILENSMKLPFPTNNTVDIITSKFYKNDKEEYINNTINLWNNIFNKDIFELEPTVNSFSFNLKSIESYIAEQQLKNPNLTVTEIENNYFNQLSEILNITLLYSLDSISNNQKVLDLKKIFFDNLFKEEKLNEIKSQEKDISNELAELRYKTWRDVHVKSFEPEEALSNIINEHNKYLENNKNIQDIAINYAMYKMFNIINTPINLIQAQAPVDKMTAPLKEIGDSLKANQLLEYRTPGNIFNKYESFEDNHVGKDCIGIDAVGLKAFFGLTNAANSIINGNNQKSKYRLLQFKSKAILNEHYQFLANINPQINEKIINDPLYKKIKSYNKLHSEDSALTLSALLSLATDNAKELELSKLNAGTKTMGMYIYGTAIGISFDKLSTIMTSDVALKLTDLTKGNIFLNDSNLFSLLSAFDYLYGGPINKIKKFDIGLEDKPNERISNVIYNQLKKEYCSAKKYNHDNQKLFDEYFEKNNIYQLNNLLIKIAYDRNLKYEDKLDIFDNISFTIKKISNITKNDYFKLNKLLNICSEYVYNVNYLWMNEYNKNLVESLEVLSEGAEELRTLGSIYSLNQGLKNKQEEILNSAYKIEDLLTDRTKIINKRARQFAKITEVTEFRDAKPSIITRNKIDLEKFCFDNEYREEIATKYDSIKHTFNIIDAITETPHFNKYVMSLSAAISLEKIASNKFNFIYDSSKKLFSDLKIYSKKNKNYLIKGLSNYYDDYVRKCWMLDELISINIPVNFVEDLLGSEYNSKSNYNVNNGFVKVQLGTAEGDALFKAFFENVVIPQLLKGKLNTGDNAMSYSAIKNNQFIKDLILVINTNNITKNPIFLYSLPINMMPRTDEERMLFTNYKSQFNNIAFKEFSIKSGNKTIDSYSLLDLFYYYGLIAHYGKQGQQSIIPIFENYHTSGQLYKFHQYESLFNEMPNLDATELYPYILKVGSIYTSNQAYIYANDKDTMETVLFRNKEYRPKITSEQADEYAELMEALEELVNYDEYNYSSLSNNSNFERIGYNNIPENIRKYYTHFDKNIDRNVRKYTIGGNNVIYKKDSKTNSENVEIETKVAFNRQEVIELNKAVNTTLLDFQKLANVGKTKANQRGLLPEIIIDGKKQIDLRAMEIIINNEVENIKNNCK